MTTPGVQIQVARNYHALHDMWCMAVQGLPVGTQMPGGVKTKYSAASDLMSHLFDQRTQTQERSDALN